MFVEDHVVVNWREPVKPQWRGKRSFRAIETGKRRKLYVIRSSIWKCRRPCRICGACKYCVQYSTCSLLPKYMSTFMILGEDQKGRAMGPFFTGAGAVQSNLILLRSTTAAVSSDAKLPVSAAHEPACTATSVYYVQITKFRYIRALQHQ